MIVNKRILLFFLLLFSIAGILDAAIITSTATGGDWATGSTWDGGNVPASTDAVVIATTGTDEVTINTATTTCASLTINSGATLSVNRPFTVSGATSISGTINFGSTNTTSRLMTFTGAVTLNNGAVWNETNSSAIPTFSFGNSLTNNATTFTSLSGVHTFTGTGMTLSGSTETSIPNVAITGTCTNSGTLTVETALSGTGGLTNSATGVLNLGGTATLTTLTATAAGNTVNYTGAAQTAKVITYSNLTLSGSGIKTFATTPTVNGILSMEGDATVTVTTGVVTYGTAATLRYNTTTARTASAEEWISPFAASGGVIIAGSGVITTGAAKVINVGSSLTIYSGATLTTGTAVGSTLTVIGATNVSGTLILDNTGAKTFTGNVTINTGGVWNETAIAAVGFGGNFINNATTFTANTGVHTFSGATKTISGTTTTSIPTATFTGAYTNSGTLTVPTLLTVTGVTVTLTNNDTINANTALSGTGGLAQGATGVLNIGGTSGITTLTATTTGNTVNYNGAVQTIKATTYSNLTLSNTGAKSFSGTMTAATLTITGVVLTNTGTITTTTALSGSGGLTQGTTGVLNIGGLADITTLTATASGNTVNYTGTGQTLKVTAYHHLTLSGGTKTFGAITTIAGNLTLSGTATAATGAGLSIGGKLDIGNLTTFTAGAYALTVTGTTTVGGGTSGNLTISSITGAKLFTGLVTVAAGATWNNSGNSAVEFRGGITSTPAFTGGSGVHTFSTNAQALTGTFSIPSVTVGAGVTLTNNNTLTCATTLAGAGLTNSAAGTLNLGGTTPITTLTATAAGNTVNYNGAAAQTIKPTTYSNLIVSGSGAKDNTGTTSAATITVTGVTLTNTGTINATTGLEGSGGLTQGTSSVLNIGGTSGITTLTATATGNTVNYNAAAAQTLKAAGYYNLTLSGGAKDNTGTSTASTLTVTSTLTNNGTLSATTALSGAGSLTQGTTGVLNIGGTSGISTLNATASGNTVNYNGAVQTIKATTYSNLTLSGSGAKDCSGAITAATLTISAVTFFNTGTITATTALSGNGELAQGTTGVLYIGGISDITTLTATATGNTVNYNGAVQTLKATSYDKLTLSGGAKDNSGTLAASTLTVTGVTLTNTGTITASAALSGNGGLTQGTTGVLNIGGISDITTLTATATGNTVNYNGDIQTIKPTSYDNLTLSGGAKDNSGTLTAATLTVTGVTLTNNGTITSTTALSGTGELTQGISDVLNIAGISDITTLTAIATGNTVNYTGTGQTLNETAYHHLNLSGGAENFGAITTIAGNLTFSGTATATTGADLNIGGNLVIGNGTTFTAGAYALTVTGTTTVGGGASGSLIISSATGTKLFTGLVSIASGATWNNSGNSAVEFRGGITSTPAFTGGSGEHTFSTNAQALTGTFSIPSVTVDAGITLTNNNILTCSTTLAGTGGLTNAASAVLNLNGTTSITTLTATAAGNTVNYTGKSNCLSPSEFKRGS
jgi:hypothetical protein